MGRTANLRRQHDGAIALVVEIKKLALRLDEIGNPYRAGLKLAKLTGLLRIHFAQEDKLLYPYMIRSAHPDASNVAADFQTEMGGLGVAYGLRRALVLGGGHRRRTRPVSYRGGWGLRGARPADRARERAALPAGRRDRGLADRPLGVNLSAERAPDCPDARSSHLR